MFSSHIVSPDYDVDHTNQINQDEIGTCGLSYWLAG